MTRRIVDNHDINTRPGQFSLLGFRTSTDPGYKKRCLDLLIEKGSAAKAAEALGISPTTVNHHAWTYLIANMDEARQILNSTAEGDNRYGRSLTDDEFLIKMTAKAMQHLSPNSFLKWAETNKTYLSPQAHRMYKVRYPVIYDKLEQIRNSESVSA